MVNPFDRTFFRFVLGFAFILSMSFAVLFFAGRYQAGVEASASASANTDANAGAFKGK